MKILFFQINHLLALRREDLNHVTGIFKTVLDFVQRETFARSRAAAKERDEIL